MRRAPLLAIAGLLTACGAAEVGPAATPPVQVPDPAPIASAIPTASAAAAPPPRTAATAVTAAPAPLAEPLLPLTRSFTEVRLPALAGIVSIHGRGPRDVWMLTEGGVLVQHDGMRVLAQHDRPCLPRSHESSLTAYGTVLALPGLVRLYGMGPGARGSAGDYRATLANGGRWRCSYDGNAPPEIIAGRGGVGVALRCGWGHMGCALEVDGAPPVPLPAYHASRYVPLLGGLWPRAADDVWTSVEDDDTEPALMRFRGTSWRSVVPIGDRHVADLWTEADGTAWVAFRGEGKSYDKPPADRIAHWDGRTLSEIATPAGFKITKVIGAGPREVWFAGGGRAVYQWDGERLRRGEVPFEVADAWGGPEVGVWIAGSSNGARAARLAPGAP